MTEMLCGLIGLLLGAGICALGSLLTRTEPQEKTGVTPAPGAVKEEEAEAESERVRLAREQHRALQTLLNYSAEVAYGQKDLREDRL